MSYKSQLLLSSSYQRMTIRPSWGSSAANLQDMQLSSWLGYDSTVRPGLAPGRIKWNTVLGLALATTVSASIRAGIVLAVERIWK